MLHVQVSQDGSTPAPSQKEMAKIIETFESFDADKSGEIDREEMGAAMIAMVCISVLAIAPLNLVT